MRVFLTALAVCLIFRGQGQAPVDSLRNYYIQDYPDHFFIWPVLKRRALAFDVSDRNERIRKIEFIPNNRFTLGAGMYVFELLVEIAFAVPLDEENSRIYGETRARDWQINMLSKRWGADVYYQKYEGFYKKDSRVTVPSGEPFPQRPDLQTRNFGASGFYVFNHRRFSLRSSFNFADRQIRSQGSFILYGTINSFKTMEDSVLLSSQVQADIGRGSDFSKLKYTTLSIAPGYSHNFIWRKFFLNTTLLTGPAHHWIVYRDQLGDLHHDISINSTAVVRFALGYSNDKWFCGTSFSSQARIVKFEDVRVSNNTSLFRLQVGFRFVEKGVLKKKAWEFLPFNI